MMSTPPDNRESREYLLSQYLDGQLDELTRADLERELASDAELASMLSELRRVDDWVRTWGERVPVVDAEAFVAGARLRRENADAGRRVIRLHRWMAPLAAAAAVGLLVTGWLVTRSGPPAESHMGVVVVEKERMETHVVVEPPAPSEARPEAVVIVSFSRGAVPAEDAREAERPRLMVTSGAVVSVDESVVSAEWSLF
ncbi:MAG: hypothetical protein JXB13_08085 [Phycisphaerae bacterium]|nr:hypothetical protein [Phycisphaerae bacterium]